jgi:hypothetical protein
MRRSSPAVFELPLFAIRRESSFAQQRSGKPAVSRAVQGQELIRLAPNSRRRL